MKINITNTVGIILLSFFVIIAGYSIYYRWAIANLPSKYAIGKVYNVCKPGRGNSYFDYYFELRNKKYDGTFFIEDKLGTQPEFVLEKYKGRKFLVKYLIDNPDRNFLLLDVPAKHCMGKQPPEGWEEIPKCEE